MLLQLGARLAKMLGSDAEPATAAPTTVSIASQKALEATPTDALVRILEMADAQDAQFLPAPGRVEDRAGCRPVEAVAGRTQARHAR